MPLEPYGIILKNKNFPQEENDKLLEMLISSTVITLIIKQYNNSNGLHQCTTWSLPKMSLQIENVLIANFLEWSHIIYDKISTFANPMEIIFLNKWYGVSCVALINPMGNNYFHPSPHKKPVTKTFK